MTPTVFLKYKKCFVTKCQHSCFIFLFYFSSTTSTDGETLMHCAMPQSKLPGERGVLLSCCHFSMDWLQRCEKLLLWHVFRPQSYHCAGSDASKWSRKLTFQSKQLQNDCFFRIWQKMPNFDAFKELVMRKWPKCLNFSRFYSLKNWRLVCLLVICFHHIVRVSTFFCLF